MNKNVKLVLKIVAVVLAMLVTHEVLPADFAPLSRALNAAVGSLDAADADKPDGGL